jgi:ribosomal protein L29
MAKSLPKEVETLMKMESELTAAGTQALGEQQSERLARVRAELAGIAAANPGIIEHVRKDIAQGLDLLGKRNYQKGLSLVRRTLLPLATRAASGLVVTAADLAKLNHDGAALGDHTLISLEQNKLCRRTEQGDLVLPWEWDM